MICTKYRKWKTKDFVCLLKTAQDKSVLTLINTMSHGNMVTSLDLITGETVSVASYMNILGFFVHIFHHKLINVLHNFCIVLLCSLIELFSYPDFLADFGPGY